MKTQETSIVEDDSIVTLRVAGGSQLPKVSGAIVKSINSKKTPHLVAIGAGAVNQALKAVCVARGMIAPQGYDIYVVPGFCDEIIDGRVTTAIILRIFIR